MTKGGSISARRLPSGRLIVLAVAMLAGALTLAGCEGRQQADPSLEAQTGAIPLDGLSPSQKAAFIRGAEQFERSFTIPEGLGPLFNQSSCVSCHPGNGRGTPATALTRFSKKDDPVLHLGGPQLQDKSIPGVPPEVLPRYVDTSVRMPPQLFGAGLIESIPEEALIALTDPDDANGDGISGRVNLVKRTVSSPEDRGGAEPGRVVGRFGLKANVSSLLDQVVSAYREDIGITSDFLPEEVPHPQFNGDAIGDIVPDPELSASQVRDVVTYVRLLAPPQRGEITDEVRRGEALFTRIGCVSCHVPTLKTGPNPIPALNEVEVRLYSDLLLHDVGYFLGDGQQEEGDNGYEWRTSPLWGLRLAGDRHGGTPFYMHDGRTSDLREVIWMHLGEATEARNRFLSLPKGDQKALIAFLMSL